MFADDRNADGSHTSAALRLYYAAVVALVIITLISFLSGVATIGGSRMTLHRLDEPQEVEPLTPNYPSNRARDRDGRFVNPKSSSPPPDTTRILLGHRARVAARTWAAFGLAITAAIAATLCALDYRRRVRGKG